VYTGQRNAEVLLEIMLLDANIALPSNVLTISQPCGHSVLPPDGPTHSDCECKLHVLVSRAVGLPLVPLVGDLGAWRDRGGEGGLQPPSPFVALKAMRDASQGGAVQGATQVAKCSCDPVWCATLQPCQVCVGCVLCETKILPVLPSFVIAGSWQWW
jgi:hypothetical protein